jgi:SAM-dependent methyltransferase
MCRPVHPSAFVRNLHLLHAIRGVRFRRALDAGCDVGTLAIFLADRVPAAEVVAYDLSPSAIAVARARADAKGLTNVVFTVRDLRDIAEVDRYGQSSDHREPGPRARARRHPLHRDAVRAGASLSVPAALVRRV